MLNAHSFNVLTVYIYGSSNIMNQYYYELNNINCAARFSLKYTPKKDDNFAKKPPTPLIQEYYKVRVPYDRRPTRRLT
jgi:hypothetical protein